MNLSSYLKVWFDLRRSRTREKVPIAYTAKSGSRHILGGSPFSGSCSALSVTYAECNHVYYRKMETPDCLFPIGAATSAKKMAMSSQRFLEVLTIHWV
jgi:hypothetical protein